MESCEIADIAGPISKMKRLRHREVKSFPQGGTAGKLWCWGLKATSPTFARLPFLLWAPAPARATSAGLSVAGTLFSIGKCAW